MNNPKIPYQCLACINFDPSTEFCKIHEHFPGEYGREDVKECPSFVDKNSQDSKDLHVLLEYIDNETSLDKEEVISKAIDRILSNYETKYKVMIVGIARRKIKSIIKMVDIIDSVLDKMNTETIQKMVPSQAIRLLSELNNSVNNDLTFIMKLVNPDTKLQDLQMWIDARSLINIDNGVSQETEMKAEEILKLSGTSRDNIRKAFDALLYHIDAVDAQDDIDLEEDTSNEQGK